MDRLKEKWRAMRPRALARVAYWFVRGVASSLRVRKEGYEKSSGHPARIYCGWHGRSLIFANTFRNLGFAVIISHSNDGDLQTSIFQRLGYFIIRGSSARGGERALVEAIRALRAGKSLAMTPDGPRGPSGVLQPGVILMAKKSGAALVPVGISCRPRLLAKSWDRYLVPIAFGRAEMIFGDPIFVEPDANDDVIAAKRLELEREIHRLEAEAERRCGYGAT